MKGPEGVEGAKEKKLKELWELKELQRVKDLKEVWELKEQSVNDWSISDHSFSFYYPLVWYFLLHTVYYLIPFFRITRLFLFWSWREKNLEILLLFALNYYVTLSLRFIRIKFFGWYFVLFRSFVSVKKHNTAHSSFVQLFYRQQKSIQVKLERNVWPAIN